MPLLDAVRVGVYVVHDGRIGYANAALCELTGWSLAQLLGEPHEVLVAEEMRPRVNAVVARRLAGQTGGDGAVRCLRRDGSAFEARGHTVSVRHRGAPAVLVTLVEVDDLAEAARQARWSAGLLERTEQLCRTGSFEVEMPAGRLHLSAGLRVLVGGDTPRDADLDTWALVPEEERAFVAGIWRNAVAGEPFEFQHRLLCSDGQRLTVLHRGVLHAGSAGGESLRGVALLQDITAQREAEQQLQDLANHNEVTGLANRAHFLDQVDAATHAARWSDGAFTLLAIDVARIDEVKSTMGFGAGDTLAMAIAARLKSACRSGEQVAHLADSEFALLIEHAADLGEAALRERAHQLQAELAAAVRLAQTDVYPRAVIGLATFPAHGETPPELLERAQTARLAAQSEGIAFFEPDSSARAVRAMQLEGALRHGLQHDELHLVYQPQVDLASGAICGAEALLRWTSAAHGAVAPSEFIPLAERNGLIGQLSDWVLRTACRQAAAWHRDGLPAVRVCVNLSPAQLQRPDLARHIQAILVETGADPTLLGVELTESMAMADTAHAAHVLGELRAVGIDVALDDFGTGHSSLSCLRSLPVDVVKVDRSFVHDVTAAPEDVSVTRAIINMAHGLQMRVLVEGVETEGQLALLAANACDAIQGYWFSRPVPADAFATMLREGKALPERYRTRTRRARTLLLVDDEENILAALKRLLRRDGYHILTANGAQQALQVLAEHEVDVIVSDQRMPGMTGVELLRHAKELYPETVRIVLSGYTELQSILDAVNEGSIYRFLTKPWDDDRLRAHVAEAFKHKAMDDENRRLTRQVELANTELAAMNDKLAQAVARQDARAALVAAGADGMREVLEQLPLAIFGFDVDGTLSFVNRAAEGVLPQAAAMLGQCAEFALPPALVAAVAAADDAPQSVRLGNREYEATSRSLEHGSAAGGCVLMLQARPREGCTT